VTTYDLALDPNTGGIVVEGGDLKLITDPGEAIAQSLRLTLRTVLGEWFLDATHGVDYFGTVLVKGAQRSRVESEFRDKILGVAGVNALVSFVSTYDEATRRFGLTFTVDTDEGEITVSTGAPP
jgi:hypothetical protein